MLRMTAALEQNPAPGVVHPQRSVSISARGQLVLRGIEMQFANSTVHALRGIDLNCEPGEFVVVVGPSGCGKSTLLHIAGGMIKPDCGEVTLDGDRKSTRLNSSHGYTSYA